MNWMKLATALPVGHSRRVNCWKCGGKKTASISNLGKYYAVNCFKCKEVETQAPPPMTPQERIALHRAQEAFVADPPTIPDDFTTDIPIAGLLWLSKGGLHVDDIKHHGFGWSDRMQRVIMPVHNVTGSLVAVQARRVDPNGVGPKYLGQVWDGPRPVFIANSKPDRDVLVLTEDILSACRVGKVCTAWSLLGTNLMHAVINQIAESQYTDIAIWMDPDEAGVNARRKMLRQLGAVGIEARAILSDVDPKHHTLEEMKDLIWKGAHNDDA
jgi:DNA primase